MNHVKLIVLSCFFIVAFNLSGCTASKNETKNTAPTFHVQTQNPDAKPTRVIPEYVTAWPKQVAVEKPDPVLGDKLVWEHWIYGEEFAKRFEGFPLEKADKELLNSPIKAVVLRIYKTNMWIGVNPNFPEQYATDIDLYFDSNIKIPLSGKERPHTKSDAYPKGVSQSFKQLKPLSKLDEEDLKATQVTYLLPQHPYKILVTPLDGRFTTPGTHYYPKFLNGMSFVSLKTGVIGGVVVPLQQNGALWLSLFGKTPYYDDSDPASKRALTQSYKETNTTFEPGEHPENKGYVKLPHSFYEVALPKMALIKVLNVCIADKQHLNKASKEAQEDFLKHCKEMEEQGVIYNLYQNKYGLSGIGF